MAENEKTQDVEHIQQNSPQDTHDGPIGKMAGRYSMEKTSNQQMTENRKARDTSEQTPPQKTRSGGGCGGGSGGGSAYQASDKQCHETPEQPKYKLEIETNKVPENWWDKIQDFDPRVYDAIAMEQAAACVDYIFKGLPDMRELEHQMEARKHRKICPKLKVQVPRTKVIKPKEIKYETTIDTFIKKD